MEELNRIQELIQPILKKENILLYEVEWTHEGKMQILRIAIMFHDGTMDIETCAVISEKISKVLDEEDFIQQEYYLEVCSAGAERKLKTKEEVIASIGKHIFAEFKNEVQGVSSTQGELMSYENDVFTTQYFDKGRKKTILWKYEDAALVRLAIKF